MTTESTPAADAVDFASTDEAEAANAKNTEKWIADQKAAAKKAEKGAK